MSQCVPKIVIEGKKYSWYVRLMAKIPHLVVGSPPVATPASRVIAPPLANTQTVRSSRYKRRGDRLLNAHTVVNFARPSKFISSATVAMYVLERVNWVKVNLPVLCALHLFNLAFAAPKKTQDPAFPNGVPATLTAIVTLSLEHGSDSEHAGS